MCRHPRHRLHLLGLVVCVAIPGCDKLHGRDGGEDGDMQEKAANESSEVEAHAEEPRAKSDDEAEEAKRKREEADANRKAEEDAKKPIVLSNIAIEFGGTFGGGGLRITATGKVDEAIPASSYVHAKASCRDGERVLTDTGYVNTGFQKQLDQHAPGETADLQGLVFTQGLERVPTPCQLEFRLGGAAGGISLPIGMVCFDAGTTKVAPCDPPVVAVATSGGGTDLEIVDLSMKEDSGFGARGLDARYVVQVNKPVDPLTRVTLKAACEVGETRFVDLGTGSLSAGPFRFESGESVVRTTKLFWNPSFGFAEAPTVCDLGVSMWASRSGMYGEQEETVLATACYRDGESTSGPCDPSRPAAVAPAPMSAASVDLDNVVMQIEEPWGGKGDRFQLELQVDATVRNPVDHRAGIQGKVTCKVGRTARVENAYVYGIDLFYLQPGETTRMTTTVFTANSMEQRPGSCEVVFLGGERFSISGDEGIELGRWCLEKDEVKKGKC